MILWMIVCHQRYKRLLFLLGICAGSLLAPLGTNAHVLQFWHRSREESLHVLRCLEGENCPCPQRRRWVLKLPGKRRKRQLLRSLFSDPLPEGHPVDRDNSLCLIDVLNCGSRFAVTRIAPRDSNRAHQDI